MAEGFLSETRKNNGKAAWPRAFKLKYLAGPRRDKNEGRSVDDGNLNRA